MKRLLYVSTLALAIWWGAAGQAAGQPAQPYSMVMGMRPAVAEGDLTAVAWAAYGPDGRIRVRAAAPVGTRDTTLGPGGRGDDGAPALVAAADGSLMLAAARGADGSSRIWWRVRRGPTWSETRFVDSPWNSNHHPALAAGASHTWLVWVASDPGERRERIVASTWNGRRWSAPETLPRAPGTPMAPRLAIDRAGVPVVVWAASDGNDAEIWVSRRSRGAWQQPLRLTDNDVPDIEPVVAPSGARVAIAWSRFSPEGYFPMAIEGSPRSGRWSDARQLDTRPGSTPLFLGDGADRRAAWASFDVDGSVLRSVSLRGGESEVAELGRVPNARISASGSTIAWALPQSPGTGRLSGDRLETDALMPAARRASAVTADGALEPTLPGTYRAFGDSITEGVIVVGGVVVLTAGYPAPLTELFSALLDRPVLVINDGLAGESTPEGVERLAGLALTNPKLFTFLMEGTNDVSGLIDASTIVANLRAMAIRVRLVGGIPLLGTLIPRVAEGDDGVRNEHTNQVNLQLAAMAAAEGFMLVDQNAAFVPRPDLYSDRLHPSEAGYDLMAQVWFQGLKPVLIHLLKEEDTDDGAARAAARPSNPHRQGHQ